MRQKGMRSIQAAAVLIVIAAVLFFVQYLMQRDRGGRTVTVHPAVEQKLVERERMVLGTWIGSAFPDWVNLWRARNDLFELSAFQRTVLRRLTRR